MENCSILTGNRINHKMISEAIQLDRISYPGAYQLQVENCYNYYKSQRDTIFHFGDILGSADNT